MRADKIKPSFRPSENQIVSQCKELAALLRYLQANFGISFVYTDKIGRTKKLPLQAPEIRQVFLFDLGYSLANLTIEVGRVEHFVRAGAVKRGSEVNLSNWLDKMMSSTAFYGGQWGEEGKRVVEYSYGKPEMAVRVLGSCNAGSVITTWGGEKVTLRHLPGGTLNPAVKQVMIAQGASLSLGLLLQEFMYLRALQEEGRIPKEASLLPERIKISPYCHLVLPHHAQLSSFLHSGGIGSEETGSGTAQAAIYGRQGSLTIGDLTYGGIDDLFLAAATSARVCEGAINAIMGTEGDEARCMRFDHEEMLGEQEDLLTQVQQFADTGCFAMASDVEQALRSNRIVHFLATQGLGLDPVLGIRPFNTSDHTGTAGLFKGIGIEDPIGLIPEHMAVVPAYLTLKGNRPFPTEIQDPGLAQRLRRSARQFNNVMDEGMHISSDESDTSHRLGHMDSLMIGHYLGINHITQAGLTKLDVWDGVDVVRVGVGYDYVGPHRQALLQAFGDRCEDHGSCLRVNAFIPFAPFMRDFRAVYQDFPWRVSVRGMTTEDALPQEARRLIAFLEEKANTPFHVIKTGPAPQDMIMRRI